MRFRLESELVQVLLKQLPTPFSRLLGKYQVGVATELPVNARIVDIVLVGFSQESFQDESVKSLNALSQRDLDVLAAFARRKTWSPAALAAELFLDSQNLERLIEPQIRRGLVKRFKTGSLGVTGWPGILPPCMIAIEAKISRWEEALQQALRHTSFADYSLVAMDEACLRGSEVKASAACREARIGLITVRPDGGIKFLAPCLKHVGTVRERTLQRLRAIRELSRTNTRGSKYSVCLNIPKSNCPSASLTRGLPAIFPNAGNPRPSSRPQVCAV